MAMVFEGFQSWKRILQSPYLFSNSFLGSPPDSHKSHAKALVGTIAKSCERGSQRMSSPSGCFCSQMLISAICINASRESGKGRLHCSLFHRSYPIAARAFSIAPTASRSRARHLLSVAASACCRSRLFFHASRPASSHGRGTWS